MPPGPALKPTLWRTCRMLANRTRLRLFGLLVIRPNQNVVALAERLDLSLPVASQYLRGLNARGFLAAKRVGRQVYYRVSADPAVPATRPLVRALEQAFRQTEHPEAYIFKLATAFTHPRRLAIVRALSDGPCTAGQLRALTRIPRSALARHLAKLQARGFVGKRATRYSVLDQNDAVGRALSQLARG